MVCKLCDYGDVMNLHIAPIPQYATLATDGLKYMSDLF